MLLANQKVEIGKIMVQSQPEIKAPETPMSTNKAGYGDTHLSSHYK
jgi:hypothetical protein